MLKYIIAVSNAALPPALLIGVFLAYVGLRAEKTARRYLWGGAAVGLLAAVVLVYLKKTTGWVVREYYNLAVLLPLIALEIALLLYVAFSGRERSTGAGASFLKIISLVLAALWVGFWLPDILFFPFDFGVGMDTVINTRYAYKVMGYAVGVIAVVLVLSATRILVGQLSPRAIQTACLFSLAVIILRHILTVLQIGLARNMLPRSPFLLRLTIDMLNHAGWFLYALLALAAVCALAVYLKSRFAIFEAENRALARKLKAAARSRRRWCGVLLVVMALCLLSVTVGAAYENQEVVLDPPREVAVRDGAIFIPVEQVEDGKLHRFKHNAADGTEMRYIVIKKNETAFGVGLDACDICGASGYYERNDQVICILCDVVMNKSTIGFPGGCNPVPLAYRIDEGFMRIEVKDLEKDVWRFKE